MKPESCAIGQALLNHHQLVTSNRPPGRKVIPSNYTIQYGVLCSQAGLPDLVRIVGTFLGEIAEWCDSHGFPPLNSLAVNATGMPGDGYDAAGGFKMADWPRDVERCIRWTGYPTSLP